jgi:hypothetical protein
VGLARAHRLDAAGLPKLRRLSYLLREIGGSYPCSDRLLFVTDGGHYENLGLVELLRRRCTDIVCIDASGDAPPVAGALADALSLAYDELGVRITLDDEWALVPGSGTPLEPGEALTELNGRLARRAVITGTVTYPAESGLPTTARTGRIVVAKALLTPELPYDVLAYAARHPVFPHDSTSDQWFDHGQFSGYSALGRELGRVVEETLGRSASAGGAADVTEDVAEEVTAEVTEEVAAEVTAPVTGGAGHPVVATAEPPQVAATAGSPQGAAPGSGQVVDVRQPVASEMPDQRRTRTRRRR